MAQLLREPAANPLERRNFLPEGGRPPISSDRRLLRARRLLEDHRPQPPRPLALPGPARGEPPASGAEAVAPAGTPEAVHSDLLAWLQAPQRVWLESLGLRPKEWDQRVLDLEPMTLTEQDRARLLREALTRLEPGPAARPPDWVADQRGRGSLPGGAAGAIEADRLSQRWQSLQALLEGLGEERRAEVAAAGLAATLTWRGDQLVLTHTARPQPAQRLELWLALLLACAAEQPPRQALLVGRDADRFDLLERLDPLPAGEALTQLEQLRRLRERHRDHCWPVPPRTGWAWAEAELARSGSGLKAARNAWEGGFAGPGEREQAEMALCFGAALTTAELVEERFSAAALTLLQPLLECRSATQAEGRRR
jgi:exodeoxyribonuclease V gamma subunit